MKAPDKIYIPKEEIEERKPWIETSYDPNWDECYVRKDALIEWLLKGVEASEICESEYGDACAQAYQAVIDKLNSM